MKPAMVIYKKSHIFPSVLIDIQDRFRTYLCEDVEDFPDQSVWKDVEVIWAHPGGRFGPHLLAAYPRLRYIVVNMTATPHIEPIQGVQIINLEQDQILGDITCTAEHTLAMILSLHSRIPLINQDTREGNWNRFKWGRTRMLSEMTLGIIGSQGRVAGHLYDRAKNLFRNIMLHDRVFPVAIRKSDLLQSISNCDAIAICTSGNDLVIGPEEIDKLPHGAIIVNTAQPENLDTSYAIQALEEGKLWGLGLDVVPNEYNLEKVPYTHLSPYLNFIMTQHTAGSTHTAWLATQRRVFQKLLDARSTGE